MDAIRTEKLTKYYGKSRGIAGLDLRVGQGEFFGYIGPNGAGKSTTIRTLLGFIRPSSGKAAVLGKEVGKETREILKEVGYLPSEAIFYQGMRVRDVLRLSARLRKEDCREEAERLCRRLGLDGAKKVEELSFGNRKKAAIVCALQHNPRLLILDEPTSGLDPLMQREFFQILKERNEKGATIFLSSHVLSEIQRNCTRAAIVRQGRMIACDHVETLARTNAKRIVVHGDITESQLRRICGVPGTASGEEASESCGILGSAAEEEASESCGIRDLQKEGEGFRFLYAGDINWLVRMLAGHRLTDLSISEPDLEEIFLHYYQDGGEGNDIGKA